MSNKSSKNIYNNVNKHVSAFLNNNSDQNALDDWNMPENQTMLEGIINNSIEKLSKNTKGRTKDKNAPKNPMSTYICFYKSEYDNIKAKNLEVNNKDLMKVIAMEWENIKNDETKIHRFKEMSDKDKSRYNHQMTKFKQVSSEVVPEQQVKKAKSNYILFCGEYRSKIKTDHPSLAPKEVMAKLGEAWQKVKTEGGDEFKKYEKMAEDDKIRFLKEKEADPVGKPATVEASKPKASKKKALVKADEVPVDEAPTEVVKPASKGKGKGKAKSEIVKSSDDKPKKLNGYIKYLNSRRALYRSENPTFDSKRVTKDLAEHWGKLSDPEKQTWKESE